MDSQASKIHANFDLKSLVLPRVSPCLLFLHVLQGIARAIGVSNFFLAFRMVSLTRKVVFFVAFDKEGCFFLLLLTTKVVVCCFLQGRLFFFTRKVVFFFFDKEGCFL